MKDNSALMALSFVYVTKLSNVEALANSHIEYINLDSSDNSGKKKKLDVDKSVFEKMKTLKHLFLTIWSVVVRILNAKRKKYLFRSLYTNNKPPNRVVFFF